MTCTLDVKGHYSFTVESPEDVERVLESVREGQVGTHMVGTRRNVDLDSSRDPRGSPTITKIFLDRQVSFERQDFRT